MCTVIKLTFVTFSLAVIIPKSTKKKRYCVVVRHSKIRMAVPQLHKQLYIVEQCKEAPQRFSHDTAVYHRLGYTA